MNATELRKLTYKELGAKLDESKEELFNLRMQKATGQLENPARFRLLRRDLARVLTLQHELLDGRPE